jgi:hypothetical protein
MESWKEILFWTIYLLMMTVVPLTPNEQNYWSRYKTFTFSGIAQVFYGDESARL